MAKPTRFSQAMIEDNIRKGVWELTTFTDVWNRNARDFPDKEAFVDSRLRLTWSQAKHWTDRLALAFIEMGIKKDEVVVIQLPPSAELCLTRHASEKAGLVFLPILRSYRQKEVKQFLAMTHAAAIITLRSFRDFDYIKMLEEMRPDLPYLRHIFVAGGEAPEGTISVNEIVARPAPSAAQLAKLEKRKMPGTEFSMIMPTSGTTGFPKLCENPIMTIMVRERANVKNLRLTGDDVFAIFTPAPGGSNGRSYYAAPLVGAKVVSMEHWDALNALQLIQQEKITVLPLVPTQLIQMLKHPDFDKYDLSSLRIISCMGAVLPYSVATEAEARLGGNCKLVQNYSAVGCSVGCMGSIDADSHTRLTTVGKPYGGAEIRLIDDDGKEVGAGAIGEIMLRGPGGDSGFFGDPEATRQAWSDDGWFKMGDLGKLDARGNLTIVGRKKEMIIRGGQNIYPTEIETILVKHPKIRDVAIVAMPDPLMGEKACAYVEPKPGQKITLEEIVAFLKEQSMAVYKLPERLEIVEKMPMVAEGQKIDKKFLAQDIANKLKAVA